MKRAHKMGTIIVAILILTETAVLIYQFCLSRRSPSGKIAIPREDGGRERGTLVDTHGRISILEERMARIEFRLNRIAEALESDSVGTVATVSRKLAPAVQVLDKETLASIEDVRVVIPGAGGGRTNANGIFNDDRGLLDRKDVWLYHLGYDTQHERDFKLDSTNMVTFTMEKGGDASLSIKTNLIVRGMKVEKSCGITLQRAEAKGEIRSISGCEEEACLFSGLGPGSYVVKVLYYYGGYPSHNETVHLEKGERKVLQIDVKTDLLARIKLGGVVLNKRDGKPIPGVRVNVSSNGAETGDGGAFSFTAERAGFYQTYLSLAGPSDVRSQLMRKRLWNVRVRIDGRISEELARKLEFHLDPVFGFDGRELRDEDGHGVFCDGKDCVICEEP